MNEDEIEKEFHDWWDKQNCRLYITYHDCFDGFKTAWIIQQKKIEIAIKTLEYLASDHAWGVGIISMHNKQKIKEALEKIK